MGKHSVKKTKQQDPKLQALAKRKKEMKVFKLPTDMSSRINKKAKKVTSNLKSNLKQLNHTDRRDKVDNQLKALHEKLVVKQAPKPAPKMKPTPIPERPPGTKEVETTLEKMHV